MDTEAAKKTLGALFDRIDAVINKDGEASYEELQKVFGEHADSFLQYCDKDSDKKLSKDEFVDGILQDCGGMSQEDFDANWANRMEQVVSDAEQQGAGGKKVLLVCTSVDKFPDGSATGWYLPEAAHPYWKFAEAGHDVTWASIQGGVAPCDPSSVDASAEDAESMKFWNDAELKAKTVEATLKLEDCSADDYDAIFFAGGFGVMWDFPESEVAQKLIVSMYEAGKPVAAVCHGPIVFLNVKLSDGSLLVAGKEITGFTNGEEEAVGKTEVVAKPSGPGSCEDALSEAGATFKDGGVFQANVCVAGNLFTGQNPPSAAPLADAVNAALK